MHLIITHPNADFDAVASLLAAHRLYPESIPLLPHVLNRNVSDFITLYESHFPFVRPGELARQPIARLTVVDTQQIPTLKNLQPDALIHIIDHHEAQRPPAGALLSLTDTGATVTLLVEQLRELPGRLSPLEATLFLLGIYEDTGALTYANTTPRDLYAAAWLLGEGRARLDMVREYLHYAMREDQKALYEQLANHLETHSMHGHVVMIGAATVDRYVPEISSIAHRLRDLYAPDALFVLVAMPEHVQMVARSTTSAIDVGRITKHFGGGGHARAAAALIKGKPLAEVERNLRHLLPLEIQPALTVGQIMSKGVHTLSPSDTIQQAAQMMDWYGHEGFPIVEPLTGKIVGILSRREVDKALRHNLGRAPISQFMTKGEFFVKPEDGLDAVRRLMVEQRIGQVPVINPNGTEIMGIVTRTDLINLWSSPEQESTTQPNLSQQLAQRLSPDLLDLLGQAGRLAHQRGDTLYIVGGFVRDLLLLTPPFNKVDNSEIESKTSPRFDLDLVVEGEAIALAEQLQQQYGGRVVSHRRFGTAKLLLARPIPFNPTATVFLNSLDFVTARTEFYRHPSALPEVERSSIRLDLHRRDFTINTLALNLSSDRFGELLDFYSGQNDLQARLIRVLHSLSFVEDPTRMLRAARLLARLDCTLESRTAEHLHDALDLLARVSGERLYHELELIFRERWPALPLQQLDHLGILKAIHPALRVEEWQIQKLAELAQLKNSEAFKTTELSPFAWPDAPTAPDTVHYLGLLLFQLTEGEQTAMVERLNLRLQQRAIIHQLYTIRGHLADIIAAEKASQLYHLLVTTTVEARQIAWLASDDDLARHQLTSFQTALRQISPLIDGAYLKTEFQLPPGPIYRTILETLRDARLDGQVTTLADERAMAVGIIETQL